MLKESSDQLVAVAVRFSSEETVTAVRPFGAGHINDTFLVSCASAEAAGRPFILQRLNRAVFSDPALVIANLRTVCAHMEASLRRLPLEPGRRWELPNLLPARDGRDFWVDSEGGFWRALSFIADSESFDTVRSLDHAREIGLALGTFHSLLQGLPAERLADPLPGFHIAPGYLRQYDQALARHGTSRSQELEYALQLVRERRALAFLLEDAKAAGRISLRPIHGDPKIDNIMMDTSSGQAVAMVDLDTVKPGLVHYDIGDCLRSACNPLGEEPEQWEEARFELELCRAVLEGYCSRAGSFLLDPDYELLYEAILLLPFELGLRFLTDHLAGNIYFKAEHREHNLLRALAQLKLAASIEAQEKELRAVIEDLRRRGGR